MTSIVVGEVDAVTCKYVWVIDKFRERCASPTAWPLKSPEFLVTNTSNFNQCQLQLGEEWSGQKNTTYLLLVLSTLHDTVFEARTSFKVLNDQKKVATSAVQVLMLRCINENRDVESGTKPIHFVERNFVLDEANKVLLDGKLTIQCVITINANEKEETNKRKWIEQEISGIKRLKEFDRYEHLIDENAFSDVSFVVEDKTLRAHKCILAKSSAVFSAMFQAEMKEKRDNTVEIEDIKHDVFLEMLRFIYAGKINDVKTHAGELLVAADKYSLDGLKSMCEESLCDNLNVDNVIDCIKLADRHSADHLKAAALKFIVSHAAEIVDKPEFKQLPPDVVCEICSAMAKLIK